MDKILEIIERLAKKVDLLGNTLNHSSRSIIDHLKIAHKENLGMLEANQKAYHNCIEATNRLYEALDADLTCLGNSVANTNWPI